MPEKGRQRTIFPSSRFHDHHAHDGRLGYRVTIQYWPGGPTQRAWRRSCRSQSPEIVESWPSSAEAVALPVGLNRGSYGRYLQVSFFSFDL